jgi:dihydrofolate reductase
MRKLISLMHVSLDGLCAGPKGEMDWITMNDTIHADATVLIDQAGAAVYGRSTYGMMHSYWPKVLKDEKAPAQWRAHARWVEDIPKYTFSRTLEGSDWNNLHIRRDVDDIQALKQEPGHDLLIFGSPGLVHSLLPLDVIDEYWIFLNPVLLGEGVRFFTEARKTKLELAESKLFDGGVMRLHYRKAQQ